MTEIVVDPLVDRNERPLRPPPPPLEPDVPRLALVLGAIGKALILSGVIVLLFVVFQLWGTNLQEARAQDGLRDDLSERFDTLSADFDTSLLATPVLDADSDRAIDGQIDDGGPRAGAGDDTEDPIVDTTPVPAPSEIDEEILAALFPDDGDALARIEIPSIEVDKVVVRGVAVADLRKGPGHYSQTSLPGNSGNASIAGHRTTYGAPFNRIDELVPGDEITVTSIQGEFTYRILDPTEAYADELDQVDSIGEGHIIVNPSAVWVLGDFGDDRLTLTACHPKLSSRQRIIVAAELIDDAVELPEWVIEAGAERDGAESQLGADDTIDTMPVNDDPVLSSEADPAPAEPTSDDPDTSGAAADADQAPTADLDEGLSGERDAIPPAAAWMLAAVTFWYVGGRLGRRFATGWPGRVGLRLVGLVPAAVCLWYSFELIDRALPAA